MTARGCIASVLVAGYVTVTGDPSASYATSGPATIVHAGWHAWRQATGVEKDQMVASTITGIDIGWLWAYGTAQRNIENVLFTERDAGRVTDATIALVSHRRMTEPPRFSKPLRYYSKMIDGMYAIPVNRGTAIAGLLLCFSDTPVATCKNKPRT